MKRGREWRERGRLKERAEERRVDREEGRERYDLRRESFSGRKIER